MKLGRSSGSILLQLSVSCSPADSVYHDYLYCCQKWKKLSKIHIRGDFIGDREAA